MLRLRQQVFIVEQNCVYLDADGFDPFALHLSGRRENRLIAYARIFAPGIKYPEACIGRVVTHADARRTGAGRLLMTEAVRGLGERWPGAPIRIEAQQYLERFYAGFGFETVSDVYLDDGIPHISMRRP